MYIFNPSSTLSNMYLPDCSMDWEIEKIFKKNEYNNVLLISFSRTDSEQFDLKKCFNDTTHIFTYGRNLAQSSFSVVLALLFGEMCSSSGTSLTLKKLSELYNGARMSKTQSSIQVTIGGHTVHGFLGNMSIGRVDPKDQSCAVTFNFIVDEDEDTNE